MDISRYIIPIKSRIFCDPSIKEGQQRYIVNKVLVPGERVVSFSEADYADPNPPWNNQKYYVHQVARVSSDWFYRQYDGDCVGWHEYMNNNGDATGAILLPRDVHPGDCYHDQNLPVIRAVRSGYSNGVVAAWDWGYNPAIRVFQETIQGWQFIRIEEESPFRTEKFWYALDVGLLRYERPGYVRRWFNWHSDGDAGITVTTCKGDF